jgi:hypothetical protein
MTVWFGNNRSLARVVLLLVLGCTALSPLSAQEVARPARAAEAERTARELFAAGEYDKAIPVLLAATKEYPDDLVDLGLLGMAYLYSSSRMDLTANLASAQKTLDMVIDRGGEATFLVGKGDDSLKSQIKYVVKAIQGELRISKTSLSFVPNRATAGAAVSFSSGDLKECGLNRSYGKDSNTFHLKTSKETLNFRPLHFSQEESNLVCSLAAKYLGVKTVN